MTELQPWRPSKQIGLGFAAAQARNLSFKLCSSVITKTIKQELEYCQ
jgi:hypothetical protein